MRIRREAKENFTWVHNAFIRDKRLSLDEKGLLLLMLSLPMTWKFTVSGLAELHKAVIGGHQGSENICQGTFQEQYTDGL